MARTGQEAAGLVGVGGVVRQAEGPQRAVAYVHAVGIGVELGAGGGVLQVVFAIVLVHPCPLDIGPVGEHTPDEGLHIFGNHALRDTLGLVEGLIFGVNLRLGGGEEAVVLAEALVADVEGMALNQRQGLPLGLHGVPIQLHAVNGGYVGAAPVEVHPAVIVHKQVGVPEGEGTLDFLIGAVENVFRPVSVAVLLPAGGAEIHPLAHHPHVRGVVVQG